jgi:hypothetical protein
MSKIVKPFGELRKEIIVRADDKGLIVVDAFEYTPAQARGFRPTVMKTRMDSRLMVLALLKVVTDYTSALFQGLTPGPQEDKPNGKEQQNTSGDAA